jgi:type VI secretion system protein ImpC
VKSSRGSLVEVNLDVEPRAARPTPRSSGDTPFRIIFLGDFSGRENRGMLEFGDRLAARRPLEVDRDSLEAVMARLSPTLRLPLTTSSGPGLTLSFSDLDDFHPDLLWARLDLFRTLRAARARLLDSGTFKEAARELELTPPPTPPGGRPSSPDSPEPPDVRDLTSGNLLDQVVEQTGAAPAERPLHAADGFARFLRDLVAPHLVPGADPRQAELVERIDHIAGDLMWALMHHPDFQHLEAAWRALFFLIRRLETGRELKLYVLDISKGEMARDLAPPASGRSAGLHRLLVEQTAATPGADPWALIVGNYVFEATRADAELLGRLGELARAAGAPFLAAASASLLGCRSWAEIAEPEHWRAPDDSEDSRAWAALRSRAEASYLGLALPRFLLRLPYGRGTEAIESFNFEEMPGTPRHEDYLWGNPAFALALLVGQAFREFGWGLRLGAGYEIANLPLHAYRRDGESCVTPVAEIMLTEDVALRILEKGIMPLASLKDRDAVRLVRFQSLADPPRPLAGRWS